MMNHGAFSVIHILNAKACNENYKHHQDLKGMHVTDSGVESVVF